MPVSAERQAVPVKVSARWNSTRSRSQLAFGIWAAALALGWSGPAGASDPRDDTRDGDVEIERFHTSDLFPGVGSGRHPDWGLRGTLKISAGFPLGANLRISPWGKLVAERYDAWHDRDLQRWTLATDLRGAKYRLRFYGERTGDELSFPVEGSEGAFLDRTAAGGEFRFSMARRWRAHVRTEYERQDFIPAFDEHDGHRWTIRTGIERSFGRDRVVTVYHEYRRARSVTGLFSFEQNALRASAEWPLTRRVAAELEVQLGIRNYRTGQADALNFGRGDDVRLVAGSLGRPFIGPVTAELRGEWRDRASTRDSKNYDVSTIGFALRAGHR